MSANVSAATLPPVRTDILRPARGGLASSVMQWALAHAQSAFAVLRRIWPIARLGRTVLVTRHDDVREVFLADTDFPVPYRARLDVIMDRVPFFLGMGDTDEYRRDTAAMRSVVRPDDIGPRLVPATAARAEALVAASGGRIEVVDQLARNATFDVLCPYFGITDTSDSMLRVWATRLFEYQFADDGSAALHDEVARFAPALRAHIDALIAARRAAGPGTVAEADDTVLGRCLRRKGEGTPGFADEQIRSSLVGFLVGGLPQPPMVVPQALEQLLRRDGAPDHALAGAQAAARAGDDALLAGYVFEALRFDPLAPALTRVAARERVIAEGTSRAVAVPAGATVLVGFASAMMDPRRIRDPARFDPGRPPGEFMHFGHGLHTCFGIHINQALLPQIIKPLLVRPRLRRAPGQAGRLSKRGPFADRLEVAFDPA
jgi:cytochrome P450